MSFLTGTKAVKLILKNAFFSLKVIFKSPTVGIKKASAVVVSVAAVGLAPVLQIFWPKNGVFASILIEKDEIDDLSVDFQKCFFYSESIYILCCSYT
jgi:hypothetical protein